jgi:hypothetical protein
MLTPARFIGIASLLRAVIFLDAMEIERQRVERQRVGAELAGVKETLRQVLDEDEEPW